MNETHLHRIVWAEMARRKLMFHANEKWQDIRLWGLFSWGMVSALVKTGELHTEMSRENKIVWVWPSPVAYMEHIKPLLDTYTLDELSLMADGQAAPSRPVEAPKDEPAPPPSLLRVYQELTRVTPLAGTPTTVYAVYNTLTGDLVDLYTQRLPKALKGIPQLPGYKITPGDHRELLRLAKAQGLLRES